MSRCAVVVWLLAVTCTAVSRAANQNASVCIGQNAMLPCPCSEDTTRLVWQIGEKILVNDCCNKKQQLHKAYENRTQVFLSFSKGNCSLLLHNVISDDQKTFTCYTFVGRRIQNTYDVELNVKDAGCTDFTVTSTPQKDTYIEPNPGFSVGVPLTLILVILGGLIVALLIRKHWQRRPRMVVIQEPQTTLSTLNYTPV